MLPIWKEHPPCCKCQDRKHKEVNDTKYSYYHVGKPDTNKTGTEQYHCRNPYDKQAE